MVLLKIIKRFKYTFHSFVPILVFFYFYSDIILQIDIDIDIYIYISIYLSIYTYIYIYLYVCVINFLYICLMRKFVISSYLIVCNSIYFGNTILFQCH